MYNPPAFREDDLALQHRFIRERRFALIVSAGDTGLAATALPLVLDTSGARLGVLSGHVSKANDHWKTLDGADVLLVYQGPDAYVTPTWYPSKAEHGKVVPTWNYVMVQVRGTARVIHDADWLHRHVTQLTDLHEHARREPWAVSDAPASYIDAQVRGIVGLEVAVREIDGKWKVSQNRAVADRLGVANGLALDGQSGMADLVRDRAK